MPNRTPTSRKKKTVAVGVGGGVALYLAYRWYKGRQAAGAAASSSGLAGGSTIPGGQPVSSSSPTPGTLAQWEQAALAFGKDPLATLNAVSNWLAGNCVDQASYTALTQAVASLGLPPGMTTFPVLTVCSGSSSSGSSPAAGAAPAPMNAPNPLSTVVSRVAGPVPGSTLVTVPGYNGGQSIYVTPGGGLTLYPHGGYSEGTGEQAPIRQLAAGQSAGPGEVADAAGNVYPINPNPPLGVVKYGA